MNKKDGAAVFLYSTVPLPDGIVIGGPWPHTIISWPGGNSRGATKPEYDLFQALERVNDECDKLRKHNEGLRKLGFELCDSCSHFGWTSGENEAPRAEKRIKAWNDFIDETATK